MTWSGCSIRTPCERSSCSSSGGDSGPRATVTRCPPWSSRSTRAGSAWRRTAAGSTCRTRRAASWTRVETGWAWVTGPTSAPWLTAASSKLGRARRSPSSGGRRRAMVIISGDSTSGLASARKKPSGRASSAGSRPRRTPSRLAAASAPRDGTLPPRRKPATRSKTLRWTRARARPSSSGSSRKDGSGASMARRAGPVSGRPRPAAACPPAASSRWAG
jgi:hypothetical protein